jgi:PAS domain S-box-containing protein
LPFYGKLLLEDKILLFLSAILLALGLLFSLVGHRVLHAGLRQEYLAHAEAVGQALAGQVDRARSAGDAAEVQAILERTAATDERLDFLAVLDLGAVTAVGGTLPDGFQPDSQSDNGAGKPVYHQARVALIDGELLLGFEGGRIGAFLKRVAAIVLVLMALPLALILYLTRRAVRFAVRPLADLTEVADRISIGDLDARIDFGVRVHCWDIKNCQQTDCKAYMNFTEQCWYVDGTPCEGYEPHFPGKLEGCRSCEVYRAHRGDRIVQLADAFGHMTNALKASRDELVDAVDYQKRLIENSFDGVIATDAEEQVTIFNHVAEKLTGYKRDQVMQGMDWRPFFAEDLTGLMDKPLSYGRRRRLRGFSPRESKLKRIDGASVDVRLSGLALFEGGRFTGNVFVFQDLREIKKLQADLLASERMAATGQAAASISHSIKNILGGLTGGVYVYKRGKRIDDQAETDTGWDMVERNIGIIADLVKDLLNFAKDRTLEFETKDLEDLFSDVVAAVAGEADDRVRAEIVIEPGLENGIPLDSHSMHQCLANLMKNAIDAIPPDRPGVVTLSAHLAGESVELRISDDGHGMTPETIEKLGVGMYSTKGSKGTGLGLMVARKIVSEHHGSLEISSELGAGSTFTIRLPLSQPTGRS